MDAKLLRKLADRQSVVPSPGDSTFIMSPTNPKKAFEVAVIHHHRFAFNYWLKWTADRWTEILSIVVDGEVELGGGLVEG